MGVNRETFSRRNTCVYSMLPIWPHGVIPRPPFPVHLAYLLPSGAGAAASGPTLPSSMASVGVHPRRVCTRAPPGCWGAVCLLGQLSGNPTAGLPRAGIPSLCLPFSKCPPQISLSPYSVPGMLLSLEITDGTTAPDSRGSRSCRGGPCVTRQWTQSDGVDRKRGEGGLCLL